MLFQHPNHSNYDLIQHSLAGDTLMVTLRGVNYNGHPVPSFSATKKRKRKKKKKEENWGFYFYICLCWKYQEMAVIHYKIVDLNLIIMPKLYLEKLHNLVHIDWKYLLQCRYQINHTIVRWVEITIQRVCLASRKRKFSTWHEKICVNAGTTTRG